MTFAEARRQQKIERMAENLGRTVAEDLLRAAIEEDDFLSNVRGDDGVFGEFDDASQQLLRDRRVETIG